ncbi:FG-GAP-like repeat-containing protein [Streptomyces cuspidosporus]|uniref:FG-GAP-like repeat-containing protein n=1 Tax=Streptomyces cuspidosporus TaxID=66882 RepID=A0ABN3GPS5_9ACTN
MRTRLLSIGAVTGLVTAVVTGVALTGGSDVAADPGAAGGDGAAVIPAAAVAGPAGKAGDVDGDGYDDLAVGAPDAAVKGHAKAGYVALTFGTTSGIKVSRHQGLTQSHTGVPGTPEAGDRFGSALALGDMDGDGHADLVVGASGEAIGDVKGAGSVTVVFGSPTGLSNKAIAFHAPTVTARQGFGGRLALGDYNHDGLQDLAVVDGTKVDLVLGAKNLRSTPTPKITRLSPPGGGAGTRGISSGDVNGDGYDDLVTVAYVDDPADEGTLGVLPGSAAGLKSTPLGRNIGLPFADYKAVVGDINADGKDDVVIDTGFSDGPDDYLLRTFPGSASGLDAAGAVVWDGGPHQGTAARLADVNGDGHADLLIGDPGANDGDGFSNAGALTVVPGGANWLNSAKARTLSLDTKGVVGVAETGDLFGSALAPGDYNGDGTADLAVGARGKWRGTGAVSVLYGGGDGPTGDGSILFGPDSFGYEAVKASFGAALAG